MSRNRRWSRATRALVAAGLAVLVLVGLVGAEPAGALYRSDQSGPGAHWAADAVALAASRPTPATSERRGPKPARTVTAEQYGAVGDGSTDDTAALQRALDAAGTRGRVRLRAGATYRHTDVLHARAAGESIVGRATILATDPARSSFWIEADRVRVDGPTFQTVNVDRRYDAYEQMGLRIAGVARTVLRDVRVVGSAAAGIYVGAGKATRARKFEITDVQVVGTRADGIHMTNGAHDGLVKRATTQATGDDGIAVVSYQQDRVPCRRITVTRSRVLGTTGGRGVSVVGGKRITYSHLRISGSDAAAVYVAQEAGDFNTLGTSKVKVSDVSIDHANTDPDIGHGAVLIYAATAGLAVKNVEVDHVRITATTPTAPWQVGINSDSGRVAGVVLREIGVSGPQAPLSANVPKADYRATNWRINGRGAATVKGN